MRYMRPRKGRVALLLLFVIFSSGLAAITPLPIKVLVDNVLGDKRLPDWLSDVFGWLPGGATDQDLLLWVVVVSVLVFVLSALFELASSVTSIRVGQGMTYDLAADVFAHLQRLSLRFHGRRPIGDTIARTNADTYALSIVVTTVLLPVVQAAIMLILMFVIMWALSPALTLLALAVVPFQLTAIVLFGRPMRTRSRRRLDLEGRMMSEVEQTLTSIPVVQAFVREDLEHRRFRHSADLTVRAYVSETLAGSWFKVGAGLVTALGTAGVMYVGARLALDGRITVGTIIVFLAYLVSLYGPLDNIAFTASTYQIAAAQADRVLEILDADLDVEEAPDAEPLPPVRGHIRYDKVSFSYEPDRPVLNEVSLEARPGEVIAVVGPTGAGKTTLVNLLLRFYDPDSGHVTIDGHDLRDVTLRSVRSQIAIVMQDPFIVPVSVAENLAYGRPGATQAEIEAAATAANADPFIRRLPDGYDTVIGQRGLTLSGGEKQRLSIARAFVKDAPILILDEPTSALDARTEGSLLEALQRLSSGRTSFVIAHRLSTIRDANRILVVEDGQIIEQGTHEELASGDGLFAMMYRQQMDVARHAPEVAPPPAPTASNG